MTENAWDEQQDSLDPALSNLSACPFFSAPDQKCLAINGLQLGNQQITHSCLGEDYDDCARYLVHILLRSQPNRVDHDWLDAG